MTFEGPQEFVEAQVAKFSKPTSKPQVETVSNEDYEPVSLAKLIEDKQPKGHHEIVTVLAFGLSQQGVEEFSEEDMRRAYLQARIRPPKVVAQAIRDAKNNFDYMEAGTQRGFYKLSHHGDRTVRFDLPRNAAK